MKTPEQIAQEALDNDTRKHYGSELPEADQILVVIAAAIEADRAQRVTSRLTRETEVIVTRDEDGTLTVGVWEIEDGSNTTRGIAASIHEDDLVRLIQEASV